MVALSFVTLFLAGLFASSLNYVRGIDPGFITEGRMMATMDLGLSGYSAREAVPVFDELLAAVESLPGTTGAAYASSVPMGDFSITGGVYAEDREYALDENAPAVWRTAVSRDWFEVAEIRLLAGRGFNRAHVRESLSWRPPTVIRRR